MNSGKKLSIARLPLARHKHSLPSTQGQAYHRRTTTRIWQAMPFNSLFEENSLYPASIPGSMQDWQGQPPLQTPFDWNAPVIDYTQSDYPHDSGLPVGTQTDWIDSAGHPQSDFMNQVLFPPTSGNYAAPVASQIYQPTYDVPIDAFTSRLHTNVLRKRLRHTTAILRSMSLQTTTKGNKAPQ
jgi:hypothetical protein